MIKAVFTFLFLALTIGLITQVWREMNNQERWHLTKLMFFSTMCSLGALVLMLLIVVLF